jgi:hypothetical protein
MLLASTFATLLVINYARRVMPLFLTSLCKRHLYGHNHSTGHRASIIKTLCIPNVWTLIKLMCLFAVRVINYAPRVTTQCGASLYITYYHNLIIVQVTVLYIFSNISAGK